MKSSRSARPFAQPPPHQPWRHPHARNIGIEFQHLRERGQRCSLCRQAACVRPCSEHDTGLRLVFALLAETSLVFLQTPLPLFFRFADEAALGGLSSRLFRLRQPARALRGVDVPPVPAEPPPAKQAIRCLSIPIRR